VKRLILCADGTWNVRDQTDEQTGKRRPTNVTKVARAIRPRAAGGVDQIVFYDEGIGTSGGWLDKQTDGAFGHGMEANVLDLYRFLVYNYEPGDELYFFGFSRGAFTVRTLAGFMHRFGLVEKDDDYYVPELYACYEANQGPESPEWKHAFRKIQDARPSPPIRFVGVWDTVGALGAPGLLGQVFNRNKYKYHDVGLNPAIQHACHALAIDERRKAFAPNLWTRPAEWKGTLEQVWFPGVHSNVGGGYAPDGLANQALHWIVEKAEALGLECDAKYLGFFKPCFNSVLHDSMSPMYRVMGPHGRPIGLCAAHGEAVHQSAVDRMQQVADYRPKNLEEYVSRAGSPATYARTARVPAGVPC